MTFSFGSATLERLAVDVHGYERAPNGEYWNDNWLTVTIRVLAGGFRGKISATLITSELTGFLSDLRSLHQALVGNAEFATMEEQLSLRLVGDGREYIDLQGEVADQPGIGNRLHFAFRFDVSQLKKTIRELEGVTSQFPVRGV